MGVERQGSKTGGGYVGGFLHLFDWNAKSRKKLFSSKSDQPAEKLKQKKRQDEDHLSQLQLIDRDDSLGGSSFKRSSEYSYGRSVTGDDVGGSQRPSLSNHSSPAAKVPVSKHRMNLSGTRLPIPPSDSLQRNMYSENVHPNIRILGFNHKISVLDQVVHSQFKRPPHNNHSMEIQPNYASPLSELTQVSNSTIKTKSPLTPHFASDSFTGHRHKGHVVPSTNISSPSRRLNNANVEGFGSVSSMVSTTSVTSRKQSRPNIFQLPASTILPKGFSSVSSMVCPSSVTSRKQELKNTWQLPASTINPNSTQYPVVINKIQLAFGAFGTKHAMRAREAEEHLAGKVLNFNVLYEAINIVRVTVIPEDGTSDATYRSSMVVGYLFKFLYPLVNGGVSVPNGYSIENFAYNLKDGDNQLTDANKPALLSSGNQLVKTNREYYPVGEPIVKSGASIQASGEAVYVDDIPSPSNCLHGAFIYSTKPLARVKDIKFKSKSLPDGVTAVITYKDIPSGGENVASKTVFGMEPLFADEIIRCAGQSIAFLAADTQKLADRAAAMAIIDYDTDNLEPPILTLEEAVERSSYFEVPSFIYPDQIGDFSKGMAEADHKINSEIYREHIKLGSQYYFKHAMRAREADLCFGFMSQVTKMGSSYLTLQLTKLGPSEGCNNEVD